VTLHTAGLRYQPRQSDESLDRVDRQDLYLHATGDRKIEQPRLAIVYDEGMFAEPPPRRRFQFRLRTLMIGVAVVAVVCGAANWYRGEVEYVRERDRLTSERPFAGAQMPGPHAPRTIPWIRQRLGDMQYIEVFLEPSASDEDVERYQRAFPEAKIIRWSFSQN
jgi:hypothetical protein